MIAAQHGPAPPYRDGDGWHNIGCKSTHRANICLKKPRRLSKAIWANVESEDISEITAVGVPEVAPLQTADGLLLRVRIEDTLGRRLPEDASASDQPEEIDLATFQEAFIAPQRGIAFVAVDPKTGEA